MENILTLSFCIVSETQSPALLSPSNGVSVSEQRLEGHGKGFQWLQLLAEMNTTKGVHGHSSVLASTLKIDCRTEKMVAAVQKPCTLLITSHWQRQHKTEPHISQFPSSSTSRLTSVPSTKLYAALKKTPRGFNPKKTKKAKKPNKDNDSNKTNSNDEQDTEEEEDPTEGVIPEVVTNRMINRMGLTVGVPLFVGLLFFPFFYYLKVGLKIDFPSWIPYILSFFFFGTALLGISYGIVSTSWDPLREGSLLGWNEAQKNWPVFWQSLRGKK